MTRHGRLRPSIICLRSATKEAPPEGGAEVGRRWGEGEGPALGENDDKVSGEPWLDILAVWKDRLPLGQGGIRHRC